MPSAKLTLRLDKDVIERGKRYAREQGTSLSQMVEQFLLERVELLPEIPQGVDVESDILALMMPRGVADSVLSNVSDYRTEYYDYVANKHLREEE